MNRVVPRKALYGAVIALTILSAVIAFPFISAASSSHSSATSKNHPTVNKSVKNDVSPPLRSIAGQPDGEPGEVADTFPEMKDLRKGRPNRLRDNVQTRVGPSAAPTPINNFEGLGNGFTGPQGTMTVQWAPPDTNGAVGAHDYVQIVNTNFAIFNKDPGRGAIGTVRYGPVAINTLWSGFGGLCEADNSGDPTAVYDSMSDRWIIAQFAVDNPDPNFYQCVAVSTTGDPTGSYYRYAFAYSNFPDYPKMGVWPDAYYETYNLFDAAGTSFVGTEDCALDRASMLTGAAATQLCFTDTSAYYGGMLPSTLDGSTLPPAGSPNYVGALNTTTSLAFWKFHVDWATPANSTFTGPSSIAVASFTEACLNYSRRACVPQSGTTNLLESLSDRVMYRLAYRNFGGYESLVVDHAITVGSTAGMRWYEIRSPNATPTLYQSGTYSPDSTYRWMGSIAQDQSGDIAMGYSTSSSSVHPGIAYTGRLIGDPLGQMTQGEGVLIVGGGSQNGTLARWGDYSAMTVDPVDDCTFWYTNEYIPSNGTFNWKTRIGSFKFANCGSAPTNNFSISASPTSLTIQQGSSGTSTINTAVTLGSAQTVNLTASVSPSGPTASLSPTSVTAGSSSTLTVNVGGGVALGAYTVTVTGNENGVIHSTTVNVNVTSSGVGGGITNGGFETGDLTGWTSSGVVVVSANAHRSGTYGVRVGSTSPHRGDSYISQSFTAPNGTGSLSLWYALVCPDSVNFDWATATLKDNTSNTTSTILGRTCTQSGAWINVTAPVTAGHSYTLTFVDHDDNYPTDPTYTLVDDVTLAAAIANPFANGDFEAGSLSGWATSGSASNSATSHTGSHSAQVGSTSPYVGDSSISQAVIAPAGTSTLTFWYRVTCPDSVAYDWATAALRDNTTSVTTTVLPHTCTNTGAWVKVTAHVTAGHSYTLTLTSHDDGWVGDATYTLYDDVSIS